MIAHAAREETDCEELMRLFRKEGFIWRIINRTRKHWLYQRKDLKRELRALNNGR